MHAAWTSRASCSGSSSICGYWTSSPRKALLVRSSSAPPIDHSSVLITCAMLTTGEHYDRVDGDRIKESRAAAVLEKGSSLAPSAVTRLKLTQSRCCRRHCSSWGRGKRAGEVRCRGDPCSVEQGRCDSPRGAVLLNTWFFKFPVSWQLLQLVAVLCKTGSVWSCVA